MGWLSVISKQLPLFVAIPLGLGFLSAVLEKFRPGPKFSDVLAVLGMLLLLMMSITGLGMVGEPGARPMVTWIGNWAPPLVGINMVLDGLSGLLLVTISLVGFASTLFSLNYMRRFTSRGYFWSLFLIMVAAMNGVVLAGDLFNLYVFLEVAAISSYGLVAFGCESEELEAAFKYLVQGAIASTMILLGVAVIYNLTGTLNMAQAAERLAQVKATGPIVLASAFFLMGFGLKTALVPFHAWLPDAHPSAPAPISAMLSGVLSMVVGVFLAIGQYDFKRLLAYHSISQMGYVVLALGVGAEVLARPDVDSVMVAVAGLCIFGGLFHLFNHAAFKSLLFLTSGSFEQQTGTRKLNEMGGLAKLMPVTSGCCRIASFSIAGVPPFNGFFSKLVIVVAVIMAGHYWLAAVTVFVSFMTLNSFIKVQRYALQGEAPPALAQVREAPAFMQLGMVLLAVVCLTVGLGAWVLRDQLFRPAEMVLTARPAGYAKQVLTPEPSSPGARRAQAASTTDAPATGAQP